LRSCELLFIASKMNMTQKTNELRPGDLVEVKSAEEILQTLDGDGTLDKLPFMPEMIEYCGKRLRVSKRVVKTCTSGSKAGSSIRLFRTDDVVHLEQVRCSGADHDGCQKACTIFWREAWLRKVENSSALAEAGAGSELLRARLKTLASPKIYFCQASEILKATNHMSRKERFTKCASEIHAGNCGIWEMAVRIGTWTVWRIRRLILGPYARGTNTSTPVETLNLKAGEWVEVKPIESIVQTLDKGANNRGLWFSPDMRLSCGQRRQIEKRIDRIIVDGTGEMRRLRNTVFIEGSQCGCPHVAFGGCTRNEYVYWREIWVRRAGDLQDQDAVPS
jgi:hypothetical protein